MSDVSSDDAVKIKRPRMAVGCNERVIKLRVSHNDLLSIYCDKFRSFSHNFDINNVPWKFSIDTHLSKEGIKFLTVFAHCNSESVSTMWSCDATVEFRLRSQKPEQKDFIRHATSTFNSSSTNLGFMQFKKYDELINFVKGDRVMLEAKITMHKVTGIRLNPKYDFLSSQPMFSDVILVIDEQKIHVNKAYLGLYSTYFHAMFFSNFAEREKEEITLEDVDLEEFLELLNVIYPTRSPITGKNVVFLLKLGDRFDIRCVMDLCETFLMTTKNFSTIRLLLFADQYNFSKLQNVCLKTLGTVGDVNKLRKDKEYKNVTEAIKVALLDRIFALADESQ